MPAFKPAYLIHGDDHGRIAERRRRLRELAEEQSGAQGVELFEGDAATPDAVAGALNALTFAIGRRFIVVDGVERWTDKQLEPLTPALNDIPPDTTVAFFAREDGRAKAPKGLHQAVKKAGGDVAAEENVKPWELPKWLIARARELDLQLEPDTARAIVAHVGDRQQRLLRELEKLALYAGPGARVDGPMVDELTAPSAEHKAWSLADTILAGDASAATALYLTLRSQGERLPGLLFWISQRVRTAHEVACALEAGEPPAQIKRTLRMPSKAADRLIADARRIGSEELQRTIEELAELELASRGGGSGAAAEDTVALLAITRVAA
ncbi:MAG TPA: DNA polymerase III subunit delta [Solirubrobacteraceae bacterium]|nr:DNA polymerase III subunit delta [Solirubrobacteraceae bacterium]